VDVVGAQWARPQGTAGSADCFIRGMFDDGAASSGGQFCLPPTVERIIVDRRRGGRQRRLRCG
jgi:hypothetical protein